MATGKGKKKSVYCASCANLLLIRGVSPICVATVQYVRGPLREIVDIKGSVSAEKRNKYNNCKFYKWLFSSVARKKKWWMEKRFRMQGVTPQKIKLSEYKLMEERRRKEIFIHGGQQKAEDESRPGRKDEDAASTIEATPEQVSSLVEDRLKEIKKELRTTESVTKKPKRKLRKKAAKQNREGDKSEKDGGAGGRGGGGKSKRKIAEDADSYFERLSEEEKRSLVADHLAGESSGSAEVDTQRSTGGVEGPSSDSVDNGKD